MTEGPYSYSNSTPIVSGELRQQSGPNSMPDIKGRHLRTHQPQVTGQYADTASALLYNPYHASITSSQLSQAKYIDYSSTANPLFQTPSSSSFNPEASNSDQIFNRVGSGKHRHSIQNCRFGQSWVSQDAPSYNMLSFEANQQQFWYPPMPRYNSPLLSNVASSNVASSIPPHTWQPMPIPLEQHSMYCEGSIPPATPWITELSIRLRSIYNNLFSLYVNSNKLMSTYKNTDIFTAYYDISMAMWYLGKLTADSIQFINSCAASSAHQSFHKVSTSKTPVIQLHENGTKSSSIVETEPKAMFDNIFTSGTTATKRSITSDATTRSLVRIQPRTESTMLTISLEEQISELENGIKQVVRSLYRGMNVDSVLDALGLASASPVVDREQKPGNSSFCTPKESFKLSDAGLSREVLMNMDKEELITHIETQSAMIDDLQHTFMLLGDNITAISRSVLPISKNVKGTDHIDRVYTKHGDYAAEAEPEMETENSTISSIIDDLVQQLTERTKELAYTQRRLLGVETELKFLRGEYNQKCAEIAP